MNHCDIEIKFSPPLAWLDNVPGLRKDPGGYVYRIRENGRLVCFGTEKGPKERTIEWAKEIARRYGFTSMSIVVIDSDGRTEELPRSA